MNIEAKQVTLRDGRACTLKSPAPEDAEAMLDCLRATWTETDFLARGPKDPLPSVEEERAFLQKQLDDPRSGMLMAFVDGEIAGTTGLHSQNIARFLHRAGIGIGVRRAYWHLGVGSALLAEIIAQARRMGIEQVELEVVAENARAIALYQKMGFTPYGLREHASKLEDGSYQNEYLMVLRF